MFQKKRAARVWPTFNLGANVNPRVMHTCATSAASADKGPRVWSRSRSVSLVTSDRSRKILTLFKLATSVHQPDVLGSGETIPSRLVETCCEIVKSASHFPHTTCSILWVICITVYNFVDRKACKINILSLQFIMFSTIQARRKRAHL